MHATESSAATGSAATDTAVAAVERDGVDAIIDQWAVVRPDLETTPMEVFGRVYRTGQAMADRIEKTYRRIGVTRGEFDVIATLRRSGEPYTLSPRQLSSTLMLTSGGMTGRLDRLERAGLLRRSPDPHDRRGLQVTLTPEGLAVVDRAVTAGLEEQRAALTASGLDEAEAAQLAALLRKLLAGVQSA
ncbi:MarR family winged helix-turn-helix transcriptional regulator [Streptomyces sp. G45]|uniref:MarR family winged helix-turn-helix transcriptional regulator n=1 Tax=Streptomyces sp. G45 TaxID=3406627 RepID=UPI003C1757B2